MSKECPKNSKFLLLKYIKVLEFLKAPKPLKIKVVNIKKKNYMEGLNSKNKNILKNDFLNLHFLHL